LIRIPYSLLLAVAAMVTAIALTPRVMALARRMGAMDLPGPRRVHRQPIPTAGGLAIAITVLGVAWLARVLPGPASLLDLRPMIGLTLAALPILALGLADDLRGAAPWTKLAIQACAGLVLHHFGFGVPVLTNPFGEPITPGWWNAPLTVAWVIIVINAVNLIDGIDGLASGVVIIASATLWWVARTHGDFYVMFFASILIGASAGFLRYNFPQARTFMGDTGSQFLGLLLAAVSLLENRKGTATVTLLFPLVALAVPIADSVVAFFRRMARGEHVFRADAGHIHHRLLRLGLGPRHVVLTLWGLSAICGLLAVLLERLPRGQALLLAAALALGLFLAFEVLESIDEHFGERREASKPTPEDDHRS
jgi:UDP-GlcNAc:undecaprenyl-phosphate GlcNAc-1-phosphate transferase